MTYICTVHKHHCTYDGLLRDLLYISHPSPIQLVHIRPVCIDPNPAHVVEQYTEILNACWNVQTQKLYMFGRMYTDILDVGGQWRTKISLIHICIRWKVFHKSHRRVAGCGQNKILQLFRRMCSQIWYLWRKVYQNRTAMGEHGSMFHHECRIYSTSMLLSYTWLSSIQFSRLVFVFSTIAGLRVNTVPPQVNEFSIKGTVSRDFFTLFFFIKHLLLVPLDTPRKDFEFFRIFEELFEFVIDSTVYSLPGSRDSPVYSSPGSRDSPVYSSPGSWDSPVVNTPGSRPNLVNKRTF
jgi:hypothetical protein